MNDIVNQKFHRLTVIKCLPKTKAWYEYLCRCDCGTVKVVGRSALTQHKQKSCGCYDRDRRKASRKINLVGQKLGRLQVVAEAPMRRAPNGVAKRYYLCQCDCGKTKEIVQATLLSGESRSCGCLSTEMTKERSLKHDLIGKRFGRLVVIKEAKRRISKSRGYRLYVRFWLCQCDCGQSTEIAQSSLLGDVTKSCGCLSRETASEVKTTHGLSKSYEYKLYKGIKARCYNERMSSYKNYGGRGIKLCNGWLNDFESFYNDIIAQIGHKPSKELSIDRINNDLNYSCGHCDECKQNSWPFNVRWATDVMQANNASYNHLITYNDETFTIAEWGRKLNISQFAIARRLSHGWSIQDALTKPVKTSKRSKS